MTIQEACKELYEQYDQRFKNYVEVNKGAIMSSASFKRDIAKICSYAQDINELDAMRLSAVVHSRDKKCMNFSKYYMQIIDEIKSKL